MSDREPISVSTLTGTGEFERKGIHVVATVVVHLGCVDSVCFASGTQHDLVGVEEVVKHLAGTPISEALEVTADKWEESSATKPDISTLEVMLEAFYRAVETCLGY